MRNGQHFINIFISIFFNENISISINSLPKFVSKGTINNILAII